MNESGRRESNSLSQIGSLEHGRYATSAWGDRWGSNPQFTGSQPVSLTIRRRTPWLRRQASLLRSLGYEPSEMTELLHSARVPTRIRTGVTDFADQGLSTRPSAQGPWPIPGYCRSGRTRTAVLKVYETRGMPLPHRATRCSCQGLPCSPSGVSGRTCPL